MEGELWQKAYRLATEIGKGRGLVRGRYSNAVICAVYFWSVVNDRPVSWACDPRNWGRHQIRNHLPSASTMSRRMKSKDVIQLIEAIEKQLVNISHPSICRLIDAKPLPISGHSEDADARYGRAASGMARGYKFHGIFDFFQGFVAWCIRPMNANESPVAKTLIPQLNSQGYLVGDNAYDSNELYQLAGLKGVQLIAPRKKNVKGIAHTNHSPFRLKAIKMMTRPFAWALIRQRRQIESVFGQLTNLSFGLGPLPNWVRTQRRVENWVRVKLILFNIYRLQQTT